MVPKWNRQMTTSYMQHRHKCARLGIRFGTWKSPRFLYQQCQGKITLCSSRSQ